MTEGAGAGEASRAAAHRPDLSGRDPGEVFTRLFDEYAPGLHRYLHGRVGEAADDLVAETFLAAWQGRATYDPERATVRAWLYAIATNKMRRRHRVAARHDDATLRAASAHVDAPTAHDERVAEQVDAEVLARQMAGALEQLDQRDLEVLLLTGWAGMDTGEIAMVLDVPVGTVRSRLHRARRRVRMTGPTRTRRENSA